MEFNKSKVYTALNADELKPGSKVIVSNSLDSLKMRVASGDSIRTLAGILEEDTIYRFTIEGGTSFALAYLVNEPVSLKWTDLKIGDIIEFENNKIQYIITGIDSGELNNVNHIHYAGDWQEDEKLKHFHKVVKDEKTQE